MNYKQLYVLSLRDTDVESALKRLSGDEDLYAACLEKFLGDTTIRELNESITAKSWDQAFTAAHALKGVAGNMGFIPLMHSVGRLLVLIRGGHTYEIPTALLQVNSSYRDISDGIKCFFTLSNESRKEEQL